MRYVLDTNVWIRFLQKNRQVGNRLRQALSNKDEICVVPVVYYELLRGLQKRQDIDNINYIRRFWRTLSYYEAKKPVWEAAIQLWLQTTRANEKRQDADILIAAFASDLSAVIVTDNVKHFDTFGLPVENWQRDDE